MLPYIFKDTAQFFRLNWKRALLGLAIYLCFLLSLVLLNNKRHYEPFHIVLICLAFTFVMELLVYYIPGINAFTVIRRLTEDNTNNSILPLFDSGYTTGLLNEKRWFFFTKPCIKGVTGGLPVTVSYIFSDRSSWSYIEFMFSPLSQAGSKRIYSTSVSFKLYLIKRLDEDVKPEVLECVAKTKESGLTSGVGRAISTKHFDAYEE